MSNQNNYDIVFSFDTTGSMYPCIREVRRRLKSVVSRLFADIPGLRIGIVAHGDYKDERETYLMKHVDLTTDQGRLLDFVDGVGNTNGFDYPEAYEYVLHKVQDFSWNADKMRGLVVIGDAYPHPPDKNPHNLDWRHECKQLLGMGINIYSVQALDSGSAQSNTFYKQMASLTNGYHLKLDQFSHMADLMCAVCFQQVSSDHVELYEQEVSDRLGGMTRGLRRIFDNLLGRDPLPPEEEESEPSVPRRGSEGAVRPCAPSKFQVLEVAEPASIKQFVEDMGLIFKSGKGFYEFTKPEKN